MMNPVLTIEKVRKSFGKKVVLKGVSGSIEEGKVIGLLGRNGEGKTTLFRILLDILEADSGEISFLGHSPNGTGEIRKVVGYVPEKPAFHEFMNVKQVLQLRAGFFPTWDWEKAHRMAKQMDLDVETPVEGASKGTLAKTAWICAAAHNPKVLLLDEPTSGLDGLVRDLVLQHFVAELAQEGHTIFVANHRMEELFGVLDEVWHLHGGVIDNRYQLDVLRENACRINGRLRQNLSVPASLSIVEEQRVGDFVTWLVLDRSTFENIRELHLFESMEAEPLPLETTFKLLLAQKGEIL